MHLLHSIFSNNHLNTLKTILLDGYLKSSSQIKNIKLYGDKKGKNFVFLQISKTPNIGMNLFLDKKLLLECPFYLHTGWTGKLYADDKKYNDKLTGESLTEIELANLIEKHEKEIVKSREDTSGLEIMSNEILVCNNISLEKYLLKIQMSNMLLNNNTQILDFIKEKYPKVKIDIT
jgi:hypothetical protein